MPSRWVKVPAAVILSDPCMIAARSTTSGAALPPLLGQPTLHCGEPVQQISDRSLACCAGPVWLFPWATLTWMQRAYSRSLLGATQQQGISVYQQVGFDRWCPGPRLPQGRQGPYERHLLRQLPGALIQFSVIRKASRGLLVTCLHRRCCTQHFSSWGFSFIGMLLWRMQESLHTLRSECGMACLVDPVSSDRPTCFTARRCSVLSFFCPLAVALTHSRPTLFAS